MQPSNDQNPTPNPNPVKQPASPAAAPVTQPTSVPQPAQTAELVNGMQAPTAAHLKKQRRLGYILSIASIVLFLVAFYYGYVLGILAFLGAYGLLMGIKTKTVPLIVLGSIGLLLNFGFYTISVFSNL
jgi:hypothetical protein